ncbi:MAG: hypothetical protein CAF41_009740 [Nitrospira sp. CG24A]|nr:MAG: hypothetical protein CAF41_009740 [Nitrospira sp. CG24A]
MPIEGERTSGTCEIQQHIYRFQMVCIP